MTGTKRIEFDRETVNTLTRDALSNAARRVFGAPGPGEMVNVEIPSWGASSAEIIPIPDQVAEKMVAETPHATPIPEAGKPGEDVF